MSYQSAITQLYELGHELSRTPAHKFDLAHVRVLLAALGNPEKKFKSVLIAGTNGKGSTASTLSSILLSGGYRTGLYTSPHLVRLNERIRIDSEEINNDDFVYIHEQVERVADRLVTSSVLPWHPSFFEMLTAMAFLHFATVCVDIAVLEVGMGGRLDATNVVEPCVSVITDISLDHQKFLGNTIAEIAREKAGIIRPGGVVVTLPQHPEANEVIGNTILEFKAHGVSAVQYVPPVSAGAIISELSTRNKYPLDVMGKQITVDSPLVGRHQLRNIALAIATAEQLNGCGFKITPDAIEDGIQHSRWLGRFQVLPATENRPETVLDVAHNPAGAWALRAALSEHYSGRKLFFVFGVMRDKAVNEVAEILFPLAELVIITRADNPRSATQGEIRAAAGRICMEILEENTVAAAVERAYALAGKEDVVVITGSIYIVGEAMSAIESRWMGGTEPDAGHSLSHRKQASFRLTQQ